MAKRVCENGHTTKDRKATHCAQCGAALPEAPRKRRRWGLIVLGSILGLFALFVFLVSITPEPGERVVPTLAPLSDIDFDTIQAQHGKMTDAQWKAYTESLRGQRVAWSGRIKDVKATSLGTKILLRMDTPSTWLYSGECEIPIDKSDALSYNIGQEVAWQGEILGVYVFSGNVKVSFTHVTIDK